MEGYYILKSPCHRGTHGDPGYKAGVDKGWKVAIMAWGQQAIRGKQMWGEGTEGMEDSNVLRSPGHRGTHGDV